MGERGGRITPGEYSGRKAARKKIFGEEKRVEGNGEESWRIGAGGEIEPKKVEEQREESSERKVTGRREAGGRKGKRVGEWEREEQ